MGGKCIVGVAAVLAAVALTGGAAALLPEGFTTTGQAYADWYWISGRSHAQWEFLSVPTGLDPYLALEIFLCLAGAAGTLPPEIQARFSIAGSAGGTAPLWLARLSRVQESGAHALYFGQLFIPRRTVGSRLVVGLSGMELGFPVGVHAQSVRVVVAAGGGASPAPSAPASASAISPPTPSATISRRLPDCTSPDLAPFLTPGTYQGSLGWSGPGTAPTGRGVYKVNLRAGQIVAVRVETEGPCRLLLLDPGGRVVGEIEGSTWLGLEYRAGVAGAWQIQVVCQNGVPKFDYRLTLDIR
ncbi:MAG: hypothetical protein N2320_02415 [Candidatus Bipolaricaulota bacterium]|nr:hypothetical protein [Candidatus Bipolaricaulota bacterium]